MVLNHLLLAVTDISQYRPNGISLGNLKSSDASLVITGLVIVFFALILLNVLITLSGKIFSFKKVSPALDSEDKAFEETSPVYQDEFDGATEEFYESEPEVYPDSFIAAVMAAIQSTYKLDSSKTLKITKITRVSGPALEFSDEGKYPGEMVAVVTAAIHSASQLDSSKTIKIKSIKKL